MYFPHIDGLRALAVLAVIVCHINPSWLPGGFTGVDVFFVISGFVVTASLASHGRESAAQFIAGFYARRLLRVAPALLVMLVITVLASVLFIPPGWLSGFTERSALFAVFGLNNVLLAGNTESYFSPRSEFNAFTHTWSLGVEEQFYLVMPLILLGWFRFAHNGDRRAFLFLIAIVVLGVGSMSYSRWAQTHASQQAFYSLFSRFWELAIGSLLFLTTSAFHRLRNTSYSAAIAGVSGWMGIALLIGSYVFVPSHAFPWPYALIPVIASALLIGALDTVLPSDPVRRLLAHRLLVAIGRRSYSLYLWHWPVLVVMRWTLGLHGAWQQLIAVALTMLFAEASFRCVENPIRQSAWFRSKSVAFQLSILVLSVGLTAVAVQTLFAQRNVLTLSQVARNPTNWYAGERMTGIHATRRCNVEIHYRKVGVSSVTEYRAGACRGEATGAELRPQLFVMGDSHALAYKMLIEQWVAETGTLAHVYHTQGCTYLDLRFPVKFDFRPTCGEHVSAVNADVLSRARTGDIAFLPALRLARWSDQWGNFDVQQAWEAVHGEHAKHLRNQAVADASQWITPLTNHGMKVLFEAPKPIFRSPPFRCVDAFNRMNDICAGGLSVSREEMERYRRPVVTAINTIAVSNPRVGVWDPLPVLCSDKQCDAMESGVPIFHDSDHVSAAGNRKLYPSFRSAMCANSSLISCSAGDNH
jgi:peptidoglycan/LPS O-acetylase OafA/YrhL